MNSEYIITADLRKFASFEAIWKSKNFVVQKQLTSWNQEQDKNNSTLFLPEFVQIWKIATALNAIPITVDSIGNFYRYLASTQNTMRKSSTQSQYSTFKEVCLDIQHKFIPYSNSWIGFIKLFMKKKQF